MAILTGTINDKKKLWLQSKGITGSIEDMWSKYFNPGSPNTPMNEREGMFMALGRLGYTGTYYDRYKKFLEDNTTVDGSISDMESQFYANTENDIGSIARFENCVFDYNPISTKITLNGSNVSQWSDSSENANHAVQAVTDSQPAYNATDSNFNNKPTVDFDGIDDFLTADTAASSLNGEDTPFTLWVVCRFPDLGGENGHDTDVDRHPLSFGVNNFGPYLRLINREDGPDLENGLNPNHHFTIEKSQTPSPGVSTATALPADTTSIALYLCAGTVMNTYNNGVKRTNGTFQPVDDSFDVASTAYTRFTLGCLRRNVNEDFWTGEIARVSMVKRAQSIAELNVIGNHLATYYGLTWTTITS